MTSPYGRIFFRRPRRPPPANSKILREEFRTNFGQKPTVGRDLKRSNGSYFRSIECFSYDSGSRHLSLQSEERKAKIRKSEGENPTPICHRVHGGPTLLEKKPTTPQKVDVQNHLLRPPTMVLEDFFFLTFENAPLTPFTPGSTRRRCVA